MANFVIPYTTPANYTYDSSKISVESGVAKLKDLRPENATFGANYNNDINGTWGDGDLNATPNGTINISGGKLDLTGYSYRWLDYDANLNADSQQTGCVRFKVTPNYSGTPSSYQTFCMVSKSNNNNANLINIFHASNGYIYIMIFDLNGNQIYNHNLSPIWQPISGTEYEFEFNWDLTSGSSKLFVNGSQYGATITNTGVRDSNIALLRIGTPYTPSTTWKPNFYLDDLIIFNTVQHTSNYTKGYTVTNIYSEDKPTIYKTNGDGLVNLADWVTFTETLGSNNAGSIKYQLSEDAFTWKYFDGNNWVVAGVSDYNTVSEINTNIIDFSDALDKIYVKAFLISNGSQKVELDLNEVGYIINTAPQVYAGTNKTAIYNTAMTPFSDCLFSDTETNITKAEWKEDGENYTEISQGVYSTLLEAVQVFSSAFTHSGNKNIYLKITDSYAESSEDILIINVNQVTVTINVQDSKNHHIPNVTWDAGDGSASSTQSSPFSYTYNINTWTATLSKNYFDSLSESNTISISITELNFTMSQETRIDELITNIDAPVYFVLGDTVTLKGQVNTNLTNYKIRCQIYDATGNTIKLATSNSGGADSQIEIINASTGEFIILCAKDLTDDFKNDITIEIEIENSSGQVRTIFKNNFHFENDNLTWTDPSI